MSDFVAFMRGRILEIALLTIASAALFSTVTYGFHVDDAMRGAWAALILIPLVLSTYFAAISYSPKTAMAGSVGFVIVFGAVVAAAGTLSGHAFFYDEYGNVGFFLTLGTIVTLLGHVMSRRNITCALFIVGGVLACALVQFLYVRGLVIHLIVFLLASIALLIVRANRPEAAAIAKDDIAQKHLLITGAGIAFIAIALSCLVFAVVVFPLNPPTQEIKLITKYYSLETVYVKGEKRVEHRENEELVSNNKKDGEKETNLTNNETIEITMNQSNDQSVGREGDDLFGAQGFNITGFGNDTQASNYLVDLNRWVIAVPFALLAIAGVFAIKILLRKRRFNKMTSLPAREQTIAFYHFFNKRFELLGINRDLVATPLEFARSTSGSTEILEQGADGASFLKLAQAYSSCVYGATTPSSDDLSCCEKLYKVFYKNARKYMGGPRYFRRFFRM